jgi:SpoVK/Ycf46/Vps4 family AAA+-type ATPase
VHQVLHIKTEGTDLLVPIDQISGFSLKDLGAPNPVIDEILKWVKRRLLYPDWENRMQGRLRRSYLFYGVTGTGKTRTINTLINLIADFVESLTGIRDPRAVFANASDFYSPLFGEAELKVVRWFKRLAACARKELIARDGKKISAPLVVVIEEIEALVRQRGEVGGSSHLFDRVLSLILQMMDSATNDLEVPLIFISTSNKRELLDVAARRRFAQREVLFSTLSARSAYQVLAKKLPESMTFHLNGRATPADARQHILDRAIHYLFGNQEEQAIVEVTLRDTTKRPVSI